MFFIEGIPDKFKFKSTTTNRLRNDIINQINKSKNKSYLEIGSNRGFTQLSVLGHTKKSLGIDIDYNLVNISNENKEQIKRTIEFKNTDNLILNSIKNCDFIRGTSDNIPPDEYDVVFIDALHTYEGVKKDFANVIKKNLADKYVIIFHDYGLVNGGVKQFIEERFTKEEITYCGEEENWNIIGTSETDDWEAVLIEIKNKKEGELK